MKKAVLLAVVSVAVSPFLSLGPGGRGQEPPAQAPSATSRKAVYGEWRIRIRPDKGAEYAKLIEEKGLPLFREAGGRMVGWWATLIGDLYEHVTIWEYDGLPAFEKAVDLLSKDERFHRFAALRDPLLSGEESRFLKPVEGLTVAPALPEKAKLVIHEIHDVPLPRREAYLKLLPDLAAALKKQGFRWSGPFFNAVGDGSEVTWLFYYESLAERDAKLEALAASPEAGKLKARFHELADRSRTRLLVPVPFAGR
jgi:hypothetical protein